MAAVHEVLGFASLAMTVVLIAAAGWSAIAGRRSSGPSDHRWAVDRAVLALIGILAAAGLLGVALLIGGSRPVDALHLVYGPAAIISIPVAVWISRAAGKESRIRRDVWIAGGGLVTMVIVLRLFATG